MRQAEHGSPDDLTFEYDAEISCSLSAPGLRSRPFPYLVAIAYLVVRHSQSADLSERVMSLAGPHSPEPRQAVARPSTMPALSMLPRFAHVPTVM